MLLMRFCGGGVLTKFWLDRSSGKSHGKRDPEVYNKYCPNKISVNHPVNREGMCQKFSWRILGHITFFLTGDGFSSCTVGVDTWVLRAACVSLDDDVIVWPIDGPLTSASPRTCSNWAVFRKSLNCSCPMCTSPLYINLKAKESNFQF